MINDLIAHAAGGQGIDQEHLSLDTPIDYVETEGTRSIFNWLQQSLDGQAPVVGDLAKLRSKLSRVVGTPESIAQWQWLMGSM